VRPPNDVFLNGRKVAGILPEATQGRVVLGIGVNVNHTADELPTDTVKPATSLRIETGREHDRAELLAAILLELEQAYDAWNAPYLR
jgi:BirA family biotin operon repressor/biotin-[acetyl-CoA-carboxylase] ligase